MHNQNGPEDLYIKGRGAQINPPNRFHKASYVHNGRVWSDQDETDALRQTQYLETHPKTVLNKVKSPDLNFEYSMNPYQGCEHGCVYCYARNTHSYWGFSAGIEFEQKILVKKNAPQLLEAKLKSKGWKASPIMLSGNTDCYQPAEKEHMLTRKMLEILLRYKHPVSLITKNALILRDLDLLEAMAKQRLVKVAISITTLNEDLRTRLEPRTATGKKRLDIVRKCSSVGIPVQVMAAPIIPSLNDHEINEIAKQSALAGARNISYTLIRLNGDVGMIFRDWLQKNYPDRYDRVIHQIEACHGGQLSDSQFGRRMKGGGNFSEIINQQIRIARKKHFEGGVLPPYNLTLYQNLKQPQLSLF